MDDRARKLILFIVALLVLAFGVWTVNAKSAPARGPLPQEYVLVQGSGWNTPCNCNHDTGYMYFNPDVAVDGNWAVKVRAKCTDGSAEGGFAGERVSAQIEKYTTAHGYDLWWGIFVDDGSALYQDTTVGGEVDYYAYFHTPDAIKFRLLAWATTSGYPPAYNPAECQYALQIWKKTSAKSDWWWKHKQKLPVVGAAANHTRTTG